MIDESDRAELVRLRGQVAELEADNERLRAVLGGDDPLLDQHERDTARIADLLAALERVTRNFRLAVQGKPVRDMAETLAEVDAALAAAHQGEET